MTNESTKKTISRRAAQARLYDLLQSDVYTDAPEYAERVEEISKLLPLALGKRPKRAEGDAEIDRTLLHCAIAEFPKTFGLRAFPGVFRISPSSSYMDGAGTIMLYTEKLMAGGWQPFAKGTADELRAEIVEAWQ